MDPTAHRDDNDRHISGKARAGRAETWRLQAKGNPTHYTAEAPLRKSFSAPCVKPNRRRHALFRNTVRLPAPCMGLELMIRNAGMTECHSDTLMHLQMRMRTWEGVKTRPRSLSARDSYLSNSSSNHCSGNRHKRINRESHGEGT